LTVGGLSPHAGHLITTEAMIAELLKKAAGGPAMPPGGGMGGMDF
jgi:chaperonin GroEL